MKIDEDVIKGLLYSSHHLEGELLIPISKAPLYNESLRIKAADSLGFISIEHATSLRFLIAHAKCNTSAFALFRLQYEALLKALWSLYIASDEQIDVIVGDLSEERAEKNNKEFPSINQMLRQLELKNTPADEAIKMLIEFKKISWKALNSYVHSGLHAVHRNMNGYPAELVFPIIRQSNNLMYYAAYLLAVLTGDKNLVTNVKIVERKFRDCLQVQD